MSDKVKIGGKEFSEEKVDALISLVEVGIISPNEARRELGLSEATKAPADCCRANCLCYNGEQTCCCT